MPSNLEGSQSQFVTIFQRTCTTEPCSKHFSHFSESKMPGGDRGRAKYCFEEGILSSKRIPSCSISSQDFFLPLPSDLTSPSISEVLMACPGLSYLYNPGQALTKSLFFFSFDFGFSFFFLFFLSKQEPLTEK